MILKSFKYHLSIWRIVGTISLMVFCVCTSAHGLSLIEFSTASDHSGAAVLEGQTVADDIYVFTTPATDITAVSYYIDDPAMSGLPYHVSETSPFDIQDPVFKETDGAISIEAEHYIGIVDQGGHAWQPVSTTGASGDGAMQALPSISVNRSTDYVGNSPRMDYLAEFAQAGTYYVWVRGMGETNNDDSVHVGLNGAAVSTADKIADFFPSWTWSQSTMDGPVATIDVPSAGVHTVNVWMREDAFIIDKIVLTTTSSCPVCSGTAPAETFTPMPLDTTMLSDGSHEITAEITLSGGGTETVGAAFTVLNTIPALTADPATLSFSLQEGGSTPTQTVALDTNAAVPAPYDATSDAAWLLVSPGTGTTPDTLSVSVDAAGLTAGTYFATITVTATGYVETTVDAGLTVLSASANHQVEFSTASDHSGAAVLEGQTVADDIYVFTTPATDITAVSYYIDDPAMSGLPYHVSETSPFDIQDPVFKETDGAISIEAEHYIGIVDQGGHAWQPVSTTGASGDGAMQALPSISVNRSTDYVGNSPRMDYLAEFAQAGTYYVWVRGMGETNNDDSVHVGLNGAAVSTADKIADFFPSWTWSQSTMDGPVATIDVPSAGVHTVNVWMREDAFIIDKIVLTTTSSCPVCSGTAPAETFTPMPLDTTMLSDGSHEITAEITLSGGGTETVGAAFTVLNTIPALTADPATLSFSLQEGGSTPAQTVALDTNAAVPAPYDATSDAAWLLVSPGTGTTPDTLSVSVDAAGLTAGTYFATITVTATGYVETTVDAGLTVLSASANHQVEFSTASDHSGAAVLEGQTVADDIYVFTTPATDITAVSYYIDDPAMSGLPYHVSETSPFDIQDPVFKETDGAISIEAEHYIGIVDQGGHAWQPASTTGASGDGAMQALPSISVNRSTDYVGNSPRMDYLAEFAQAGTYYVWVRGMGETNNDDSVHVGLNGAAVSTADKIADFFPSWTWSQSTMDGPVATIDVPSAGVHTVNVWMREDAFIIDKIVLTTTSSCPVCSGTAPAETFTPMPLDTTMLSDGSHEITAEITLSGGGTETVGAAFTVLNTIPALTADPATLSFSLQEGGSTPAQTVALDTNAAVPAPYDATSDAAWLLVSPGTGTTPDTLSVSVDAAGLTAGTYFATITVTATGYVETTVDAGLTVLSASANHQVEFSTASDHSGAAVLEGQTVADDIFVFTTPATDITAVSYFIDDPAMSGLPYHVSETSPFDIQDPVFKETDGAISIEAEHYIGIVDQGGHAWQPVSTAGASGDGAMQALPSINVNRSTDYVGNSPRMDYLAEFAQAGTYYVWVRGIGETNNDDSVHVGLNGAAVSTADKIADFFPSWTWSQSTMDGPVATIDVPSAGVHTVNVWMREDAFIIDKIVLTTTSSCPVCSGTAPAETFTPMPLDTTMLSDGSHEITAEITLSGGGTETVGAAFTVTNTGPSLLFSETFDSGNDNNWTTVSESGKSSTWEVIDGQYYQSNSFGGSTFQGSYHTGLYAYVTEGLSLTDYQASVDILPLSSSGNDVGIMFRYQDSDNYYRFSMSARYGYSRLEKKVNGTFTPLATNSRGYIYQQQITVSALVVGDFIQIYLDGDPLFAVRDTSLATGSVAVYTQDMAKFDNISVALPDQTPRITLSTPLAHNVTPFVNLPMTALGLNLPSIYEVKFFVDGTECELPTETPSGVFDSECFGLSQGDYTVDAVLYDNGAQVSADTNVRVGVGGEYAVGVGDSITNGIDDSYATDNTSLNDRIISIQGYEANLTELVESQTGIPAIFFNEGIPGDTTFKALLERIDSILARHPDAGSFLVMLGTNDSWALTPTPSGLGCTDGGCSGTYKENMQLIIDKILAAGATPIVARVSPAFGTADPLNSTQNLLIQEYNQVIETELTGHTLGPDFFEFFLNETVMRPGLFVDSVHPNALGFVVMANLWYSNLQGISPPQVPFILEDLVPLDYQQNIMEPGDFYYTDEQQHLLQSIPTLLDDGIWIMTANQDASDTGSDTLSFQADRSVTVHVLYDDGAASVPDWMAGFTDTGLTVPTTNPNTPLYHVYSHIFPSGTITLGGNMASGASGAQSNYVVVVKEN